MASRIEASMEKIEELFDRRVAAVFPSKEKVKSMLMAGPRLTFYFGIDPTGPDIHLGHTISMLLLKKLINLGHEAILLIGDFTAQTGDPTGRQSARRPLTEKEVKQNMENYLSQIHKLMSKGSFEIKYNSRWLKKITLKEISALTRQFTVQQMIARDMFQTRLKDQKAITIEEFLYPLMQGYDSVAMKIDGEVGGNDQTFNMLVGRDLVKSFLGKEKIVIAVKLLEDPLTGKKLMSKSEGAYVSLNDKPKDMFGKIMALPDQAIVPVFSLTTEVPDHKIKEVEDRLAGGENPKILKGELAFELVKMYYGESEARKAQAEFDRIFSQKELPKDIKEFAIEGGTVTILFLLNSWLKVSMSEAKRLIEQKAVTTSGRIITDWSEEVKRGDVIKVGPRRFVKIV